MTFLKNFNYCLHLHSYCIELFPVIYFPFEISFLLTFFIVWEGSMHDTGGYEKHPVVKLSSHNNECPKSKYLLM